MRSFLFCKAAPNYTIHGVKKNTEPSPSKVQETILFAATSQETERDEHHAARNTQSLSSNLFAANVSPADNSSINEESNRQIVHAIQGHTEVPVTYGVCIDQDKINFINKCLACGCTIDLLLANFIASLVLPYKFDCKPETAQILLIPIILSTGCMTYAQFKLLIKKFQAARATSSATVDAASPLTLQMKHQIQALAGLLSAIEDGVRLFFTGMIVSGISNELLKNTVSALVGSVRSGTFLMATAHATCDVPLGKTKLGALVYGSLTSPVMPDFNQLMMRSTPIIGGLMFFTVINTLLNIENKVADGKCAPVFYALASFSAMMGFLIQRDFVCKVIRDNVNNNMETVDSWNKFWYGDADHSNPAQMAAYAIKRFIDIVTALPLTVLDAANKLSSICCYFLLAMLPIQIIAFSVYATYPAFSYFLCSELFNNTQGLIKMYTGKETDPLSDKSQQLLKLIVSIPLGVANAFTILNVMGETILKGTNEAFTMKTDTVGKSAGTESSTLLPQQEQPLPAESTLRERIHSVTVYARKSANEVASNMRKQLLGENGLKNI